MKFSLRLHHYLIFVILLLAPQLLKAQCLEFSPSTIPFSDVYYISDQYDVSIIVGKMDLIFLRSVPFPTISGRQLFCNPLELAPGLFATAYVPTAPERFGDFSGSGITIYDPFENLVPFLNNMIPQSRLYDPYVWLVSSTVKSSQGLAVNAGGAGTALTGNIPGPTRSGYASVNVSSGTTPYGTAVFAFKQNGVIVTEAGVPASPPTTAARIFIDYRSAVSAVPGRSDAGTIDINTGIAVVNRNAVPTTVRYVLRDVSGAVLSNGHGTMAPGGHFAKFVDQIIDVAPEFNLPPNFQTTTKFASLEISSDQALSIVALRMTTNQRKDVLFTTTPTADLTQPLTNSPTYFPQIADGGGYTTALVLLNTSDGTEAGMLQFLDDKGASLIVNQAGGATASSFRYSIPSGGVFHLQTDGTPAVTKVGWVRVTPDAGTSTPVGAGVFGYNPGDVLVTESGVPAAESTTHARLYVDLSAGHDTGLAIANTASTNASITVAAFQSDGVAAVGTSQGPVLLPGGGHTAKFADQFIAGLPTGFIGVLEVGSATPFAALTMRSLVNERNDFLLTTFPVADQNQGAPSPMLFPQIAVGGGYVTQFILLSASGASTTTLNFYGDNGTPLAVGK